MDRAGASIAAIYVAISAASVSRSQNERKIADLDRRTCTVDAFYRHRLVGRSRLCRASFAVLDHGYCRTACDWRNLDLVVRSPSAAEPLASCRRSVFDGILAG